MSESKILKTISGSPDKPLKIVDKEIACYVLEDETRVLARAGFVKALGRTGKVKGGRKYDDEFQTPAFLTANNLKPFVSNELIANSTPIIFDHNGARVIGYKAELLPQVCEVFLDAKEAGKLTANQVHIAEACKILHRGFARIGIIGLIDEVTGFEKIRRKGQLADILKGWIEQEQYRQWTLTFPLEFYELLFKLKGWNTLSPKLERPSVVGKYTNDIVYERLAPDLLKELDKKNPITETGYRKQKQHQWLSAELGHPRLKEHLTAVMALMRASSTWEGFKRSLQRAFPKLNTNLELNLEED